MLEISSGCSSDDEGDLWLERARHHSTTRRDALQCAVYYATLTAGCEVGGSEKIERSTGVGGRQPLQAWMDERMRGDEKGGWPAGGQSAAEQQQPTDPTIQEDAKQKKGEENGRQRGEAGSQASRQQASKQAERQAGRHGRSCGGWNSRGHARTGLRLPSLPRREPRTAESSRLHPIQPNSVDIGK